MFPFLAHGYSRVCNKGKKIELVLGLDMKVFSLNFSFKETFTAIYGRLKEKWLIT